MWRLNSATPRPATAMPSVQALTARPIAADVTPVVGGERGEQGLRREEVDDGEERREPDHGIATEAAPAAEWC